jgi:hypothetical protein
VPEARWSGGVLQRQRHRSSGVSICTFLPLSLLLSVCVLFYYSVDAAASTQFMRQYVYFSTGKQSKLSSNADTFYQNSANTETCGGGVNAACGAVSLAV